MAYLQEENDELDAQPVTGPESSTITATPGAGNAAAKAPASAGASPSRFTGIQDYLKQNQGQAQQMGSEAANAFQKQMDETKNSIGQVQGNFQNIANQGTIKDIDKADSDAQSIVNQAATAPKGSAVDTSRFQEISNAQYKGPNSILDTNVLDDAFGKLKKTNQYIGENVQNGNANLLKDINKKPSYTKGQQTLDNVFLSNNESNREKLGGLRTQAGTLQGDFDAQEGQANTYVNKLKDQTNAVRTNARNTLETGRTNRTKEIQDALDNQAAHWSDDYNTLANKFKTSDEGRNLDLDAKEARRLQVQEGQNIYNVLQGLGPNSDNSELNKYFQLENFDANKVIGKNEQDQLARLDALASLYGGELTNKYTDASLAGTLNQENAFKSNMIPLINDAQQAYFANEAQKVSGGGSVADYLHGRYTKLQDPSQKLKEAQDMARRSNAFRSGYSSGPSASDFALINAQREMEAYNKQQQWIKNIEARLKELGGNNKIK